MLAATRSPFTVAHLENFICTYNFYFKAVLRDHVIQKEEVSLEYGGLRQGVFRISHQRYED